MKHVNDMISRDNRLGFTLVELLIAVLLSSLVMYGVFAAFQSQNRTYVTQDLTVEMQQNLRAAVDMISRDIRMAGFDPSKKAGATFYSAATSLMGGPGTTAITIEFSNDFDSNEALGGPGETLAYGFLTAGTDADNDGFADAGAANLSRNANGANAPVAENIQAIAFAYAYDSIVDLPVDMNILDGINPGGGGNIIWAIPGAGGNWLNLDVNNDGLITTADAPAVTNGTIAAVDTGTAVDFTRIRAVKFWLLARAANPDPNFVDSNTYVIGQRIFTPNDNFRRRLIETTVRCRNMGL